MPKFGRSSTANLETCHPLIQKLMKRVVKEYDCSILEGARTLERQTELFNSGKSTTMNSNHIKKADGYSWAVDVVPYPISWGANEEKALLKALNERDKSTLNTMLTEYRLVFARFYHFAGYVQGVADEMNIKIRWGGDWDGDNDFTDQTFHDLPHIELISDS